MRAIAKVVAGVLLLMLHDVSASVISPVSRDMGSAASGEGTWQARDANGVAMNEWDTEDTNTAGQRLRVNEN